jgi:hypothetical protein
VIDASAYKRAVFLPEKSILSTNLKNYSTKRDRLNAKQIENLIFATII